MLLLCLVVGGKKTRVLERSTTPRSSRTAHDLLVNTASFLQRCAVGVLESSTPLSKTNATETNEGLASPSHARGDHASQPRGSPTPFRSHCRRTGPAHRSPYPFLLPNRSRSRGHRPCESRTAACAQQRHSWVSSEGGIVCSTIWMFGKKIVRQLLKHEHRYTKLGVFNAGEQC